MGELPIERRVNEMLASYPRAARTGLLDVLSTEDPAERARVIGELYAAPQLRSLAEVMIDLEVDPSKRAFVVDMLREFERLHRGR